MTTKYDYRSLETEFVRGTMSLNELCRMHDIPATRISSIQRYARRPDAHGNTWMVKRAEYRARTAERQIERAAVRMGERLTREIEVRDHALEVLDKMLDRVEDTLAAKVTVIRGGESVEEPKFWIQPRDVGQLVDKLVLLLGRPIASPDEERDGLASGTVLITAGAETQFGVEALARLGELARERSRGALRRPMEGSPLPDGPEPRQN